MHEQATPGPREVYCHAYLINTGSKKFLTAVAALVALAALVAAVICMAEMSCEITE